MKNKPATICLYEFDQSVLLPEQIKVEDLKQYLQLVWQNRHWVYDYTEEESTVTEGGQPFLRFDGNCIQARNYAGMLRFQGFTIFLLPKIFKTTAQPVPDKMLAHLHFYLSYCRHIHFPFQWQESESVAADALNQWIRFFADFTTRVLHEQPYLTYQTQTSQTEYLRGKLAVQPYINEQLTRGQWHQLHTEQQPFVLDNLFNQIIKYTATLLQSLADAEGRERLQDILMLLTDVELRMCQPSDCEAVYLNRLYPEHQKIMDMCRFFLAGEAGIHAASDQMNFAFLVPMERIFEDFIAGFIYIHFPEWKAQFQKSIPWATGIHHRVIQAKPDIWLPLHQTVWDTKYKILDVHIPFRNLPSSDLYQMFAYAAACQVQNVHLLYASARQFATETIHLSNAEMPVWIHIHTLPIVLSPDGDTFSALTLRLKESLQKVATE